MTTIKVSLNETSRIFSDWRKECRTLRHGGIEDLPEAIKRYAREHGAAGVWHPDASYTLYYMDGGRLRSKKWKKATLNRG